MKKNIFLTLLIAVMSSFMTISAYAKTVEYTYSAGTAEDWTVTGKSENVTFEENAIIYGAYSGTFAAIYDEEIFEGIEYNITLENNSSKSGNIMVVYFNYQDANNYYSFTIGGAKESNPVKLIKMSQGTKTELDIYENYVINYAARPFKVVCKNGNINVSVTDSNGTTELFDIDDNTFTSGYFGIGGTNAKSKFTSISVTGTVNSYMKVTGTTPQNEATDVSNDVQPVINFDKELEPSTVTEESVYVLANEEPLETDEYYVTPMGSSVNVSINEVKDNTLYQIVVTTDVQSVDEEPLQKEYILSFETYKGSDYMEYNYDYQNASEWVSSSATGFAVSQDGVSSTAWDSNFNAVLNSYIFRDEITYSAKFTNSGGAASNAVKMLFNYTDSSNYYCVNIGGTKDGAYPMTLQKFVGGTRTDLGQATVSNGAVIKIHYKNNKIRIYAGDELKIEVQDSEYSSGRIGVGAKATVGTFKNIKVIAFGKNVQLKTTDESTISNGDTHIPLDCVAELVFNFPLKAGKVTKENIYVTENSQKLPEDSYEIELKDDNKKIVVTFKNKLKEKTEYSIEISEEVVSSEYEVSLLELDRSIVFTTKPPAYDVQSSSAKYFDSASGQYAEVNDISQMGGKDIKFNISVKNNGNAQQSFAISAMIVQADGEIIGAKYYATDLAAGAEFEKDMDDSDNTISVPNTIEAGAKMVYFVWDSFTNMISLYPSGEF